MKFVGLFCGLSCLNFECNIAQHLTSTIIADFSFTTRMNFTGDIFNLPGLNKVGKPHLSKFDISLVFYIVLRIYCLVLVSFQILEVLIERFFFFHMYKGVQLEFFMAREIMVSQLISMVN
jgi:hypothetical protein